MRFDSILSVLYQGDSYKYGHWKQYPKGTTRVHSYLESRGGMFPETVFFGLQYYLKMLQGIQLTREELFDASFLIDEHMGAGTFNTLGFKRIIDVHGGMLPVEIRAVPEGTRVNTGNVLMTIENTDDELPWLTNFLETTLLKVWYPTTVATLSYYIRQRILKNLEKTGDPSLIDYKHHDFGYRGVSSIESAAIGGAAHLTVSKGSDTIAALVMLRKFYGATRVAGHSINAAEHSTITSWGREHEVDAYRNMLEQYPTGLVAVVSDSYDIFNAITNIWGNQLKMQVLDRNGVLVIRPDSGDPATTVLKCIQLAGASFGYDLNSKGYKVLCPKVRLIQGDGVNYHSIGRILDTLESDGWSGDNIAFGMGGALLQQLNRDTQQFAIKCSAITVNGETREVRKDPTTDKGKASKGGRLALGYHYNEREGKGGWHTSTRTLDTEFGDHLVPVFRNGEILKEYNLEEIRANVLRDNYLRYFAGHLKADPAYAKKKTA